MPVGASEQWRQSICSIKNLYVKFKVCFEINVPELSKLTFTSDAKQQYKKKLDKQPLAQTVKFLGNAVPMGWLESDNFLS